MLQQTNYGKLQSPPRQVGACYVQSVAELLEWTYFASL